MLPFPLLSHHMTTMMNSTAFARALLLFVSLLLTSTQAKAGLIICSRPCGSTLGPAMEYRIVAGELVFNGGIPNTVVGSMSLQRVIPGVGNPIGRDIDFEISGLTLIAGELTLSGAGEIDPAAQGGVGFSQSIFLADAFGGVIVPGPDLPDPARFRYGFAAESRDAASGVERWASLVLSTLPMSAGSTSYWTGADALAPERFFLDLQLRELVWEVEGMTLRSLDERLVGSATLEFTAVPEPSTALLLIIGLFGLGARRRCSAPRSRSRSEP